MKKNPESDGFEEVARGSYSRVYKKDRIAEVLIDRWVYNGRRGKNTTVEASKDIIIEARKLCNEGSARYLPDAKRKRIAMIDRDDEGVIYEFLYEMPFYEHSRMFTHYGNNEMARKLSNALDHYNAVLNAKPGNIDDVIDHLVNKTWRDIDDKLEVSNACNALLAISTASRSVSSVPLCWDLKPFNMAMHGNQMIFLDPIVCEIPTKDILSLWKKNGFVIPK